MTANILNEPAAPTLMPDVPMARDPERTLEGRVGSICSAIDVGIKMFLAQVGTDDIGDDGQLALWSLRTALTQANALHIDVIESDASDLTF